jgi:crotonobetainyl-CoA:carnitine CoA-transferase CaiB-like acyl-CoA transferase
VSGSALAGVRVLDLGRLLAAPWAAQMLGDLGADVIKIERPIGGDPSRIFGPAFVVDRDGQPTEESSLYLAANRNKRSVTVDIAAPAGQAIVRELAAESDVLIENFLPGSLRRYGLDYESLHVINSRLIYCSVTGYGQDGPAADRPGYDGILQAYSGMMSVTGPASGEPGAGPMRIGASAIDVATGSHACAGILAALVHRERVGGEGQHLDISLMNTAIALQAHMMTDYLVGGNLPARLGNGSALRGRVYQCADGPMVFAANVAGEFERLCGALDAAGLLADERFATSAARGENAVELAAALDELLVTRKRDEVVHRLQRARLAAAPVYDYAETLADPQVRSQGVRVDLPHPRAAAGLAPGVASPIRLSDTPLSYDRHPPTRGEHTDEVLRELLRYDNETINRLHEQGVV